MLHLPAEGVALITSTPAGRSRGWLYTSLELRMSLLAVWRLAIDEDRGMGLMPGDTFGEETTLFCTGTLSLFSGEVASVGFAILKKLTTVLKKLCK